MPTLTVTAKGQITLKKDLLDHLGVQPGQKLHVDKLPGGRIAVRPATPSGSLKALFGSLKQAGREPLSIEEISIITTEGWADRR
jgi:AbrB family looped-hinge helix DNA binding protein